MTNMRKSHLATLVGMVSTIITLPAMAQTHTLRAGVAGGVHGQVEITRATPDSAQPSVPQRIVSGAPIFAGDKISTGPGSGLQVMLPDQTVMTLSQNSLMTVDRLAYEPGTGKGEVDLNVLQGAFRYVSGLIAKSYPESVRINTPNATINLHGTIVGGVVGPGDTVVALLGPGSQNNGGSTSGAIAVTTPGGTVEISRAGYATLISQGTPPSPPAPMTPQQIQQLNQLTPPTSTTSTSSTPSTVSTAPPSGSGSPVGPEVPPGTLSKMTGDSMYRNDVSAFTQSVTTSPRIQTETTLTNNLITLPRLSETTDTLSGPLYYSSSSLDCNGACGAKDNDYLQGSGDFTKLGNNGEILVSLLHLDDHTTFTDAPTASATNTSSYSEVAGVRIYTATSAINASSDTLYDYGRSVGLNYSSFGRYESRPIDGNTVGTSVYAYGIDTPLSQIPSSGSGTYLGDTTGYVSSGDKNETVAFSGQAALIANFSAKTIAGTLRISPTYLNGTLNGLPPILPTINLLSTSLSGNQFSGAASTNQLTPFVTMSTSGTYSGALKGAAAAEVVGTYKLNGSCGASCATVIVGSFGAKR